MMDRLAIAAAAERADVRGRGPLARLTRATLACLLLATNAALAGNIRIDTPQDGSVVYDVSGKLTVETELAETDLASPMRFTLMLDGKAVKREAFVPLFILRDVEPGEHVLELHVIDSDGKVIDKSDPVRFELRRAAAPPDAPAAQ